MQMEIYTLLCLVSFIQHNIYGVIYVVCTVSSFFIAELLFNYMNMPQVLYPFSY